MKLEEIISASGAQVIKTIETIDNIEISTDTRTIKKGDFYLPLKGANFDGENFLDKAIESGAIGCFITRDDYPENAKIVLKVSDTLETYLKLANFYRHKIAIHGYFLVQLLLLRNSRTTRKSGNYQ